MLEWLNEFWWLLLFEKAFKYMIFSFFLSTSSWQHLGLLCSKSKVKMSAFTFRLDRRHFWKRIRSKEYKWLIYFKVSLAIKTDMREDHLTFYLKVRAIEPQGNNRDARTHTGDAHLSSRNDSPMAAIVCLDKGSYQMLLYWPFILGVALPSAALWSWHSPQWTLSPVLWTSRPSIPHFWGLCLKCSFAKCKRIVPP